MRQKLGEGAKPGYDSRVGAGLSRGPNLRKKSTAAPWSQTWPAPGATLDLDFANDRGFVRGVGSGRSMDAVTFTRASNGTFVGSDGLLKQSGNQGALGKNLLTFPQDFDNAAWTAIGTKNITSNSSVAPDGTNTADTLSDSNASGYQGCEQGFSAVIGVTYIGSIYVQKTSGTLNSYPLLQIGTSAPSSFVGVIIDTTNGTLSIVPSGGDYTAPASSSITDSGNYWRITLGYTATITAPRFQFYPSASTNGTTLSATATGSAVIWGAQLEVGSTATEYFPTNINTPRFDWASTAQITPTASNYTATTNAAVIPNLLTYSEEFDNAAWTKINIAAFGSGSVANTIATLDPLGGNTADYIVENTTNGAHGLEQGSVVAGIKYNFTVYAKKAERTWLRLFFGLANQTWYNLNDGTLGTVGSGTTASIESVGNGWYRCSFSATAVTTAGVVIRIQTANNETTYTGNNPSTNPSGIYIWGAQLEREANSITPLAANPTCNGLLIEESRANRLLWCRDATNAAWTKTNVTAAKDQTGIDGVANAASFLTATADNGTCIQTITLASGSRTGSVFLKRITGTGNVQVTLDGSTWSTVDLSSTEWRRIVLSGTVTNPTVGIRLATNGDAVAMDYGQIEDGAYPTTPILTTTASVTRSVDTATMPISYTWYNEGSQTLVANIKFTNYVASSGISGGIVGFGASSPRVMMYRGDSSGRPYETQIFDGTTSLTARPISFADSANGVNHLIAASYDNANMQMAVDGVAGLPVYSKYLRTPGPSFSMFIGGRPDATIPLKGWISRLQILPKRVNEQTLINMTQSP